MGLLSWAFRVAVSAFFLLLLAILLWFVWNAVMRVFNGPELSYAYVAVIVAIVSVGAGGWTLTLPVFTRGAPPNA